CLHVFGLITIAPTDSLPIAAPIMPPPEKRRRLRLDRDLQHVAGQATDEPHHRRFPRRPRRLGVPPPPLPFFSQSDARWYSLHGVDLLRPRYQRGSLV